LPSGLKPFVVVALLIVALPLLWVGAAALTEFGNTWTYRYRITLGVSVGGKEHVGSSVIQVRVTQKSAMLPQTQGVSIKVSGEAVVVDLGNHGILFVLLKDVERPQRRAPNSWSASANEITSSAFPRTQEEKGEWGLARTMRRYSQGGQGRELQPDQLPLLVRFRNETAPSTIEQVDPTNLEMSIGPGARLTRATIETVPAGRFPFNISGLTLPRWLTGEPVTRKIKEVLPWLSPDPERRLIPPTGGRMPPYIALTAHGDFIR